MSVATFATVYIHATGTSESSFFLLLLIFTGLQITNLEYDYHQHTQTLQMRPFIQAVAKDHGLRASQVVVNSTTLTDGILVRFRGRDYRVNMSPQRR